MCIGGRAAWEISVLSSQFGCEPKTVLKSKVYVKKRIFSN